MNMVILNGKKRYNKKRMMSYFIDATVELIDEVGINGITFKKSS